MSPAAAATELGRDAGAVAGVVAAVLLEESGRVVVALRAETPIGETGHLRDSWASGPIDGGAFVANAADYATYAAPDPEPYLTDPAIVSAIESAVTRLLE